MSCSPKLAMCLVLWGGISSPALGHAQAAAASGPSVAVLEIGAKIGLDKARADVCAELVQDYLRNQLKLRVVGRSDIEAMLGLEKMKDILSCQDNSSCVAEIGGALGVDELVAGSLAKMGTYLVVSLKRIQPQKAKVVGQVTRKLKGATDDDLIEAVGPMVAELFHDVQIAMEQNKAAEAAQHAEQQRKDDGARQQAEQAHAEREAKRAEETRAANERAAKAEEAARQAMATAARAEADARRAREESAAELERAKADAEHTREPSAAQLERAKTQQPPPVEVTSAPPERIVSLGVLLGATMNARHARDGAGLTLEASLGLWRWLELAFGYAAKESYYASLRFWFLEGPFDFGVLTRAIAYRPSGSSGRQLFALGLCLGRGFDSPIGKLGLRLEPMISTGPNSSVAVPITLGGFWRW